MNIAVLFSGGVDSSVVLTMLKDQGHDVTAFYLKIWLEDDMAYLGDCPWQEDLQYARAVCQQLEVPLEIVSLQSEYHDRVVRYALSELKAGRTPSPDIFCNQRIKFGVFFNHIDDRLDKVATGHYASIQKEGEIFHLFKGVDPVKDQTYFLSHLNQAQLSRALFPLGAYSKAQVRTMAQTYRLPTRQDDTSYGDHKDDTFRNTNRNMERHITQGRRADTGRITRRLKHAGSCPGDSAECCVQGA